MRQKSLGAATKAQNKRKGSTVVKSVKKSKTKLKECLSSKNLKLVFTSFTTKLQRGFKESHNVPVELLNLVHSHGKGSTNITAADGCSATSQAAKSQ